MNVRAFILGFALTGTIAAPLYAVPTPPTPEERKVARVHYEKAVNHFNLGEYGDAAEEFRQVYKVSPQPVILYDAAQAYRLANQNEQALTLYESFLRQVPNAPVRGEVERRIAELRGKPGKTELKPDDPKTEPTKTEQAKTDPTKMEPTKTGPQVKTEKPETKTDPTKVDPAKTDTPKPQLTRTADGGSERLKPVADLIKTNRKGFRDCFDKWSAAHPGVPGKVKLTFYLDPDGNMDQAEAEESGFDAPDVASCIETFAGTLKYPRSSGGKYTRFAYPFDFKSNR